MLHGCVSEHLCEGNAVGTRADTRILPMVEARWQDQGRWGTKCGEQHPSAFSVPSPMALWECCVRLMPIRTESRTDGQLKCGFVLMAKVPGVPLIACLDRYAA